MSSLELQRERAPLGVGLLAAAALVFLLTPLAGLLVRVPWARLPELLSSPVVTMALRLSLLTASISTLIALVVGLPLAWVLARSRSRLTPLLRAVVTLPMVLPPVIGGVALLVVLGRRGVIGQYLYEWTGFSLPFTTAAVVVAQTFVAMPFLVVSVEGTLASVDRRHELAAATLGCTRWQAFRRVTLPSLLPGVAAGAVLCFARALGEFGATITFAGSFPGTTQTLPIAAYLAMETDPDAAIAISAVLLAVCLLVLLLLRRRWTRPGTP